MVPMTNKVKVLKYFWGPFIATNNFAFEVEVILSIKSTQLESRVAKIGLNGPMTNMVMV